VVCSAALNGQSFAAGPCPPTRNATRFLSPTEMIKRGKVEFDHKVLLVESRIGLIIDCQAAFFGLSIAQGPRRCPAASDGCANARMEKQRQ